MDYIHQLGALALASRMKRLVGRLNSDVKGIYGAKQIEFEPLLMPIVRLLYQEDTLEVNQIVAYLGISQPAVTQWCHTLTKRQLIDIQRHPKDQRKRQVTLTQKGKEMVSSLMPVWQEIERAVNTMIHASDHDLLAALCDFEHQYACETLQARVIRQLNANQHRDVRIVGYREAYKGHFKKLNYEWIERYFTVESSDKRILSNPKKYIIDKKGFVYIAKLGNEVVGAYALIRINAKVYELAKMAVTAAHQKKGIGTQMLDHALDRAKALKLEKLILYSNTQLAPAINMYFKKGFRVIPKHDHHNNRANITMELVLE